MLVRRSINLLLNKNYQILLKHHLWNYPINFNFPVKKFRISTLNFHRMGSSNCKSFSPTKAAANAKINETKKENVAKEEYVEDVVCHEGDIEENEMKSFDLGDEKVLLIKQNGVISALGSKCTHYGAPLASGALGEGRIRCQWHGACFNIKTGDIEDFPGLDSLPCFQVSIDENGSVKVKAKKSELEVSKRVKPMVKKVAKNPDVFVVIGGGPSGAVCAETLRQEGFTGRLVVLCKENYLPYDRVKVSKSLDVDIAKIQFRTPEFYQEYNIEVLKNTTAAELNTSNKSILLSNGQTLNYTKCYVASGARARVPEIPGVNLQNIFTLRNYDDSESVLAQLGPDKQLVVLGSSFIALEISAYCVGKVSKITVIGRDSVPLKAVFGEEIGARIKQMFEEKGVEFIMNCGIKQFLGNDNKVTSVELTNGTNLNAELCVIGIGSILNTEFLKNSEINVREDGSVPVNNYMETNVNNVFAGGDIVYAPIYPNNNEPAVIGHYGLAQYHARIAAQNMLGKKIEAKSVPFFWSMLFGKSIRYAGYGKSDDLKIEGDLKELKFVAFFFKGDKVIAMASCQRDPIVSKYAELLSQGKQLNKADILADPFGWAN